MGQENYGLFQLFVTFFWKASLRKYAQNKPKKIKIGGEGQGSDEGHSPILATIAITTTTTNNNMKNDKQHRTTEANQNGWVWSNPN